MKPPKAVAEYQKLAIESNGFKMPRFYEAGQDERKKMLHS